MSIVKNPGRQHPLVAFKRFTYADLVSGSAIGAIDLPGGAIRLRGELVIETAFNSATSDVIAIGDAASATALLANTDVTSAGRTAFTGFAGEVQSVKEAVTVRWTGAGTAPTQGAGYILVEYAIEGREVDVQP